MAFPEGVRTKRPELATPGTWVHLPKFGSKGSTGKGRPSGDRAARGFLAEAAPSTFLREVLGQLRGNCHAPHTKEVPQEGRG